MILTYSKVWEPNILGRGLLNYRMCISTTLLDNYKLFFKVVVPTNKTPLAYDSSHLWWTRRNTPRYSFESLLAQLPAGLPVNNLPLWGLLGSAQLHRVSHHVTLCHWIAHISDWFRWMCESTAISASCRTALGGILTAEHSVVYKLSSGDASQLDIINFSILLLSLPFLKNTLNIKLWFQIYF